MSGTGIKLSFGEKFGYGLGDLAANLVFQTVMALQMIFYTDTFGLSAAQAGTMTLFVGLGAALFNPVMGVIDAKTNQWLANVTTNTNSHSIAVDPSTNHAFVPMQAGGICGTQSSNGCVGVIAEQ